MKNIDLSRVSRIKEARDIASRIFALSCEDYKTRCWELSKATDSEF